MSANAPWSVKGIDAKAREVAKDLARRSGMTLGEWLNQMILEGQDVGALISSHTREAERPQRPPAASRPPYRDTTRFEEDDYAEEEYAQARVQPPYREAPAQREAAYREPQYREPQYSEPQYREPQYREPARRGAPFSSRSQPLASQSFAQKEAFAQREAFPQREALARDPSQRDIRRSIFEGKPRFETAEDEHYVSASGDLGRVARALETLGSRIEGSETRSATAVRGVSQAVESLLDRLERSEAAHADTQTRLESQTHEVQATYERLSRAEEDNGAIAARLDQAERLIDAQAERLEGLSANAREERERAARLEAQLKNPQSLDTIRAVEGALGKLANQLYEGDARTRDTLKDVRQDMVGLSHRLAQIELRDPERVAQGVMDTVVAKLAQRLEAAEAQTTGAIKTLERAFTSLDSRLSAAEARGDVSDPEAARSFKQLAADLQRRVEESRTELLGALQGGVAVSSDAAMKALENRIDQAEKRSTAAIQTMGQEMARVADGINRRVATVEAGTQESLKRVTESLESRLGRNESGHVQALERLGDEIARISERLSQKLVESERRTTQVLTAIGEQVEQQRDQFRDDLGSRIRASEERTAKLLDEARARLDEKLAKVQTQTLLAEATVRQAAPVRASGELPNPFGPRPTVAAAPVVEAVAQKPVRDDEADIDITGHLLAPVTDFKPEFDPFEDDGDDFEAELKPAPVAPAARPVAKAPIEDDDDIDPFADIDVSRKTAPQAREALAAPAFAARVHRSAVVSAPAPEDDEEVFEAPENSREGLSYDDEAETPVSLSTRDALAAARAAVRASIDGNDSTLGSLKPGVSRRDSAAKPAKGQVAGSTLGRAATASAVAVGAVLLIGGGGFGLYKTFAGQKPAASEETPIAAAAINVTDAPNSSLEDNLKAQYDMVEKALATRDPTAVVKLKALANQGYARAQWRLGNIYDKKQFGAATDPAEARKWTRLAAEGGLPEAMNNYGMMYYGGDGGPQDRVLAAMWFRKSAERGFTNAQFNLGQLYRQGDGVAMNPSEAYKWLSLAGKAGDTEAAAQAQQVRTQLSDSQRQKVDDLVGNFLPISDGAPISASAIATAEN